MSDEPIKCPSCGAKVSGGRERCPRCRALLAVPTESAPQHNPKLMLITAGLVLAFALGIFYLWYVDRPESVSNATPAPAAARSTELEPEFLEWTAPAAGASSEVQQSLDLYKKQLADNPKDADVLANLGRAQFQLGQANDAIASFQSAADAAPEAPQHRFQLAQVQCTLARWDECITTLRDARRLAPDHLAAAHNLAVALHKRGVDDVAVEEFKRARELSSQEPAVVLGLAVSQDKLGRSTEAADAYQEFIRLAPSSPLADKARARITQLGR